MISANYNLTFSGIQGKTIKQESETLKLRAENLNIHPLDVTDVKDIQESMKMLDDAKEAMGRYLVKNSTAIQAATQPTVSYDQAVKNLFEQAQVADKKGNASMYVSKDGSLIQDDIDLPGANIGCWNESSLSILLRNPAKSEDKNGVEAKTYGQEYRVYLYEDGQVDAKPYNNNKTVMNAIKDRLTELGGRIANPENITDEPADLFPFGSKGFNDGGFQLGSAK